MSGLHARGDLTKNLTRLRRISRHLPLCPSCGITRLWLSANHRSLQPFVQISLQRIDRDAILQHGVSMSHGHLAIFERLMVNRDTEGRTDLILPRVTLSDVAAVVEERP